MKPGPAAKKVVFPPPGGGPPRRTRPRTTVRDAGAVQATGCWCHVDPRFFFTDTLEVFSHPFFWGFNSCALGTALPSRVCHDTPGPVLFGSVGVMFFVVLAAGFRDVDGSGWTILARRKFVMALGASVNAGRDLRALLPNGRSRDRGHVFHTTFGTVMGNESTDAATDIFHGPEIARLPGPSRIRAPIAEPRANSGTGIHLQPPESVRR